MIYELLLNACFKEINTFLGKWQWLKRHLIGCMDPYDQLSDFSAHLELFKILLNEKQQKREGPIYF